MNPNNNGQNNLGNNRAGQNPNQGVPNMVKTVHLLLNRLEKIIDLVILHHHSKIVYQKDQQE